MRLLILLAAVSGLSVACAAPAPEFRAQPAPAAETARMSFDEFLSACAAGGWNITYDESTAALLEGASVVVPWPLQVPGTGFEGWFSSRVEAAGFCARRVGPEDLRAIQLMPAR